MRNRERLNQLKVDYLSCLCYYLLSVIFAIVFQILMFDLLSFFKYIILILFRKKKIHSLFYGSFENKVLRKRVKFCLC